MSLRRSSPAPAVASVSSRIVRSSDHLRSVSDARTRAAAVDQVAQVEQLGVELLDGARRGRRVDELVLDVLELLGGELVVVELVEAADRRPRHSGSAIAPPARTSCLRRSRRSALRSQRAIDRLRARGEPALQDGEREADRVAALAVELGRHGSFPRGRRS